MPSSKPETVRLAGLPLICQTREGLAGQMVQDCLGKTPDSLPKLVFSANGQSVAMAGTDPGFNRLMREADYIHADGQPLVFASRWLTKTPLPERIATTDFFHNAARAAERAGLSFFFFGGPEEHNRAMAERVQQLYPDLRIAGRQHDRYAPEEEAAIVTRISESHADVVWISLGRPRQEEFCVKYRNQLKGVGWLKTCGGLFKFMIGIDSRAPHWVQQIGFEWLYRLLREPRRLGWRYLVTNIQAIWFTLTRH